MSHHHLHHHVAARVRRPWLVRFLEHPHGPHLGGLAHTLVWLTMRAGVVALIVAGLLVLTQLARVWLRLRMLRAGVWFELRLPEEFERGRFAQAAKSLAPALRAGLVQPSLSFELWGEAGRVRPFVFAAGLSEPRLRALLGEALPGARLVRVEAPPKLGAAEASRMLVRAFGSSAGDRAPLETSFASDPVGLLLRSLADTRSGETLVVQLLVTTAAPGRARRRLLSEAGRLRSGRPRRSVVAGVLELVLWLLRGVFELFDPAPSSPSGGGARPVLQVGSLERQRADALLDKSREPLFACALRVAAAAPTRGVARALLAGVREDLQQYQGSLNGLRRSLEPLGRRRFGWRLLPLRPPLVLSGTELSWLCPLPAQGASSAVALPAAPARELAPSAAAASAGIRMGTSEARGRSEPMFVSPRALLQHLHLLGATGSGKSTALLNLALDAMQRDLGLLVLEPKGDLVAEVVRRVPARRVDDVVLLDFGDSAFPPAFNLLAGGPGQGEAVAAIFSRLFGGNWGPRSDDLLRAAILTLEAGTADGEVATLAEVLPLLTDPRRRARYPLRERVVLPGFWRSWEQMSQGQRQQALAPLANKLRALLLRPPVRDALVQPEAPDLKGAIAQGKIILCSLPSGSLGEDGASLFGSVLVHRVWQAAQSLGPSSSRRPFLCLLDEAHRFTSLPGGLGEVLAQARGYGLGFLLAHQQLAQLSPELRETVAVNCRNKLCFQLDPPDNERMARHFQPALAGEDLLHLDRYQLACRLVEDGLVLPPATATAAPPPAEPEDDISDLIHLRKRLTTRTKQEVEALIAERFPDLERPPSGVVAVDETGTTDGTLPGTSGVPPYVPPSPVSTAGAANRRTLSSRRTRRPFAAAPPFISIRRNAARSAAVAATLPSAVPVSSHTAGTIGAHGSAGRSSGQGP